MTTRREPLKIDVPQDDSVRLGRVGLIALAGFVIGVIWPRLAGMQLVPSAPEEEDSRPKALASASASSAPAKAKVKAAAPEQKAEEPPSADRLKITETVVTSCRKATDAEQKGCDEVEFGKVAESRLLTLAACPAAAGASGVLSIGFDLDFEKNLITRIRSGKSTTFDAATSKKLIECAEAEFKSASLAGIAHAYQDYTVFFKIEFAPPSEGDEVAGDSEAEVVEASGRATVGWNVALIRKQPRDGEVVARVLSGTNVVVTGRQEDWYRVKYDGDGNEGWVYRSAIGL